LAVCLTTYKGLDIYGILSKRYEKLIYCVFSKLLSLNFCLRVLNSFFNVLSKGLSLSCLFMSIFLLLGYYLVVW